MLSWVDAKKKGRCIGAVWVNDEVLEIEDKGLRPICWCSCITAIYSKSMWGVGVIGCFGDKL